MAGFSPAATSATRDATKSAHFPRTTVTNVPSVLKPGLLTGVGVTITGSAEQIERRLRELGAGSGSDVLVHRAETPTDADGVRRALDEAWDAIRSHMLPPHEGLIVLIAPPPGDAHRAAARAGLENLARTLSIEWARHRIRPVAILPGTDGQATAELVAYLASFAGAYYAGCAFTLR
jgi:hypothetical protein